MYQTKGVPGVELDECIASAVGGGADVTLTRHVSLRALQFDYLYAHFGGASQNNFRLRFCQTLLKQLDIRFQNSRAKIPRKKIHKDCPDKLGCQLRDMV